jgi:hypothetical protein
MPLSMGLGANTPLQRPSATTMSNLITLGDIPTLSDNEFLKALEYIEFMKAIREEKRMKRDEAEEDALPHRKPSNTSELYVLS